MSAPYVARELAHKCETIHTTLKKEGYFLYQISVLHKLKLEDYTPCYNYCDWFLEKFGRDKFAFCPTVHHVIVKLFQKLMWDGSIEVYSARLTKDSINSQIMRRKAEKFYGCPDRQSK